MDTSLTLLTDSLTSIHQLSRMLRSPATMRIHRHRVLLQDILIHLRDRANKGASTTIQKTHAHKGI